MKPAHRIATEQVAEAAADGLAVRLDLLDAVRRRVREPDVVVGADQEPRRARRRVVDGLAQAGVHEPDHGPDDVARGAELPQLPRLPDLAQHVFEQVALGVGVHPFEMQVVDLRDDLREHGGLVDDQAGAGHEVGDAPGGESGVEREDLLAHPGDQPLAVQRLRPRGPAQPLARHRLRVRSEGVARIAQAPSPLEDAGTGSRLRAAGGADARGVGRLEHVEEDEEAELLGVLGRVGVAAAVEMVADAVDAAAQIGGQGHRRAFTDCWFLIASARTWLPVRPAQRVCSASNACALHMPRRAIRAPPPGPRAPPCARPCRPRREDDDLATAREAADAVPPPAPCAIFQGPSVRAVPGDGGLGGPGPLRCARPGYA